MLHVPVQPELLRWARERAGLAVEALARSFPKLDHWERGEAQPTLKQLEAFAKATFVPIGFLFFREPPAEDMPIPDLRTVASRGVRRPSPHLLDTLYACQQRQAWYSDWARSQGEESRSFVGSATLDEPVEQVAARMGDTLGFNLDARRRAPTWTEALRQCIAQADEVGVLVMVSGVVGNNSHRKLDPGEFRGFALADDLAPLVFINGADAKAAQMFTLAHELAHIWLGESALSDAAPSTSPSGKVEMWCNRVAAELLVPLDALRNEHRPTADERDEIDRLARTFKVSTLVVLRRMRDARFLSQEAFQGAFAAELERARGRSGGGGNFYLTQAARASKRFARALVVSTFEGHTTFTEAFRLLGIKRFETLRRFGVELGVGV